VFSSLTDSLKNVDISAGLDLSGFGELFKKRGGAANNKRSQGTGRPAAEPSTRIVPQPDTQLPEEKEEAKEDETADSTSFSQSSVSMSRGQSRRMRGNDRRQPQARAVAADPLFQQQQAQQQQLLRAYQANSNTVGEVASDVKTLERRFASLNQQIEAIDSRYGTVFTTFVLFFTFQPIMCSNNVFL